MQSTSKEHCDAADADYSFEDSSVRAGVLQKLFDSVSQFGGGHFGNGQGKDCSSVARCSKIATSGHTGWLTKLNKVEEAKLTLSRFSVV